MATERVRLVILDMGGTLWEEVPDERAGLKAGGDGNGDVFYRIDSDHMFRYEGISNRIFHGVRAMFQELCRQALCVSINSMNTPDARRWIEPEIYDLNTDGFIRHHGLANTPTRRSGTTRRRRTSRGSGRRRSSASGTRTSATIALWSECVREYIAYCRRFQATKGCLTF
ncbi:MAG: hypothetical protein KAU31_00410 [Spirochaetaceae bacterium]|nr:hypothetical protein [Spirochaetaceae bacterium]